jgi:peroxiredoxin
VSDVSFRRRFQRVSRRNTYLLGGVAVIVGVVLVVVAITGLSSDGGDDTPPESERNAPETPISPGSEPPPDASGGSQEGGSGTQAEGAGIRRQLVRRRLVRAPDFATRLIHDGTTPRALTQRLQQARAGDELQFSKLRGTPTVLYLWTSRCAPCRADALLVDATWKRWARRGVLFIGLHVGQSEGSAAATIRQYDLTFPVGLDGGAGIAKRYGAMFLPQTFFVTAGGDIVGEVAGSPSVRQLELGTRAARSGEPFGSEQGSSRVPLP